ncbi:hypothetical protein DL766_009948 [Monosporascus sp. MC13-8B]|nr:hypothetical protein DL766_009948 [Monosporascus sp. MC13-8B]
MVSLVWGASLARSAVDLNGAQVVAPVIEDDPSPITDNNAGVAATGAPVENPKKWEELLDASLDIVPACAVTGKELQEKLALSASGSGGKGSGGEVAILLEGMRKFFNAEDNYDENFLFAYYRQTVASVYIGGGLGKPTIGSAMETLAARLQTGGSIPGRTVAQLCNGGRQPERVFGVFIDITGDLAGVQKTAWDWSQGNCAADRELVSAGVLPSIKHIQVVAGDSYAFLAFKYGINGADFTKYNLKKDLCSTFMPGDYVCYSAGDPYTEPKPNPPKAGPDGTCTTHLIANRDSCAALAKKYGLTISQIKRFNKGKTWAWTECTAMLSGYNMCLSEGTAPLPPPQQGTECGPLVPGTKPPNNKSILLADLNPYPLKACCNNWGFYSPFAAHCEIHAPKDGGPDSKLPGFQRTYVSNCGTEIKQNSGPPAAFERIGYYKSWNLERDCLWLKAKNVNNDLSYTQAIIDNRKKFATNLAQFVKNKGLDGVDIDWEYPGAPDILIGGQPIGKPGDGVAYLRFLITLKSKLQNKSVSIAAPVSYWYLKAFPIDKIAAVIDYIVYITYDLYGQWDYGNVNAFDSCPSGKYIRSHAGYISNAEINKIIRRGDGARTFHDGGSNTDIMLYQGDYVSYMTLTTKNTRRADFKGLNFAGSIDWAIDLQAFISDNFESASGNGAPGKEGCVMGRDESVNSGYLCAFSCKYDFCPDSLCSCRVTGPIEPPPPEVKGMDDIIAWDELNLDLNRLCRTRAG